MKKKNKLVDVLISIIGRVKTQSIKVKVGVIAAVIVAIGLSTQIDLPSQELISEVIQGIIEALSTSQIE